MHVISLARTWLTAALLLLGSRCSIAGELVCYTISPVFDSSGLNALSVELRFQTAATSSTTIFLPASWGGQTELWNSITDLAIRGGRLQSVGEPQRRLIIHKPRAQISITYKVVQDWSGEPRPLSNGNPYRSIIQSDYFHVIGHAMLVAGKWSDVRPVSVALEGFPKDWNLASDWEHGPQTLDTALAAVAVGGDFRVLRPQGESATRIAIRGEWPFSDSDLAAQIARIISAEREFWGGKPKPYLITILPLTAAHSGSTVMGGTGLDDAFAIFSTTNVSLSRLDKTLAHEFMHTWIPKRLGAERPEGEESSDFWFSEGFTEFYTARVMLRSGIWSIAEYERHLNKALLTYGTSALRNVPNEVLAQQFWSNYDAQQLIYARGMLAALLWDERAYEVTRGKRSLDDVMRTMKQLQAKFRGDKNARPLATEAFFDTYHKLLGVSIEEDKNRLIEHGADIVLPAALPGNCLNVSTELVAEYDAGFNDDATRGNNMIVAGVSEQSNAFKAGLRNGMRILERKGGTYGDSSVPVELIVSKEGDLRRISYLPAGRRMYEIQRVYTQKKADDVTTACEIQMLDSK